MTLRSKLYVGMACWAAACIAIIAYSATAIHRLESSVARPERRPHAADAGSGELGRAATALNLATTAGARPEIDAAKNEFDRALGAVRSTGATGAEAAAISELTAAAGELFPALIAQREAASAAAAESLYATGVAGGAAHRLRNLDGRVRALMATRAGDLAATTAAGCVQASAELANLGAIIDARAARMLAARNVRDVAAAADAMKQTFAKIPTAAEELSRSLSTVEAKDEREAIEQASRTAERARVVLLDEAAGILMREFETADRAAEITRRVRQISSRPLPEAKTPALPDESPRPAQPGTQEAVGGVLWVGGLLTVAASGLGIAAIGSAVRPMAEFGRASRRLMAGDFGVRLKAGRSDEIGQLAAAFNQTLERFTALSGQLAGSSGRLVQGTEQVSTGADAIREETAGIAALLDSTTASARTIHGKLNAMAAAVDAATGTMRDLATANAEMAEAGRQAERVIATVDTIARQTNLLALNAAVEAAHAGASGAGFSIVAAEVRNLALRSAEAAESSTVLIRELIGKTRRGVELAEQTGQTFDGVSRMAAEAAASMAGILDASAAQAGHVQQISQQTARMGETAAETAALARDLTAGEQKG